MRAGRREETGNEPGGAVVYNVIERRRARRLQENLARHSAILTDVAIGGSWTKPLRALVAALVGACALAYLPASPAAAATTLAVEVGYAGTYVPGQPVPVRVRVAADRLIAGELEVLVDGVATLAPVEVPGGSEKQFLLVLGTPAGRSNRVNVVARLPDGTSSPPSASQSATAADDQEIVGLLPGALAGRPVPGPAPLAVDIGTARFVALSQAELDRAPDSIRALAAVGIGADELGRLAPAARDGILQWVEAGGRLLVDAEPGTAVNGLPDAWQPGERPRARAGAGEIRFTSGAMGAGRWNGLIEPTTRGASANERGIVGGPPLGDSLARDAGFRLPAMSWLVGFLTLYVVVVGPALFVVLRRRRTPELAWVVIPLVAVLFTGASWAGGRGLRDSTQTVHGTVLHTGVSGASAITYLGVSSRAGGTLRIGWPAGWLAGAPVGGDTQALDLSGVRLTAAGPEGRLPLDANQFGLVAGRGPVPSVGGALEITSEAVADGQAKGRVRNATELRMDRTAVFMGFSGAELGPLEPGEEREWSLAVNDQFGRGGPPPELLIMGRNPDQASFTHFSLWEVAQRAGWASRDPGHAVALGWTAGYRPAVRLSGSVVHPEGKTLVVGTSATTASGARAADLSFVRDVVRSVRTSVYRFTVPAGDLAQGRTVDTGKLSLRSSLFPVDVWTGSAWTSLTCAGCPVSQTQTVTRCPPGGGPCTSIAVPAPPGFGVGPGGFGIGPGGEVSIPPEAVQDGVIYLRYPSGVASSGDSSPTIRETA